MNTEFNFKMGINFKLLFLLLKQNIIHQIITPYSNIRSYNKLFHDNEEIVLRGVLYGL